MKCLHRTERKCTQTHPKGHQSNLCFTGSQSSAVLLFETVSCSNLFEVVALKLILLRFMNKQVSGWSGCLQFFSLPWECAWKRVCVCFLLKGRTVMDQITFRWSGPAVFICLCTQLTSAVCVPSWVDFPYFCACSVSYCRKLRVFQSEREKIFRMALVMYHIYFSQ